MLAVPYFEKRLYELPDDQVTAERILQLADDVERDVELGPSPRPLLSVPHPLSDESSAYYHGYVLAEMAVQQTRAALAEKLAGGSENVAALVDDPRVGEALLEYWEPGNTVPYLDLVKRVTGGPLSAAAWVSVLEEPLEAKLAREKAAFEEGVARGPKFASLGKEGGGGGPSSGDALDLGARIVIVHGDEKVADSAVDGGVAGADAAFRAWIEKNWPRKKGLDVLFFLLEFIFHFSPHDRPSIDFSAFLVKFARPLPFSLKSKRNAIDAGVLVAGAARPLRR